MAETKEGKEFLVPFISKATILRHGDDEIIVKLACPAEEVQLLKKEIIQHPVNEVRKAVANVFQNREKEDAKRKARHEKSNKLLEELLERVNKNHIDALAEMEVKLKVFAEKLTKSSNNIRKAEQKKLFDHIDESFLHMFLRMHTRFDRMDARFDNIQTSLSNRINVLAQKVEMLPDQMALLNQNVNNVLRCIMLNNSIQNQRYQQVWNRIVELTECETDTYVMLDEFAEAFREHIQRA